MPITEMDVYDYQSYQISLDCLSMLKILYDNGRDISHVRTFMTSVHHGLPEVTEIFSMALKSLFECHFNDDPEFPLPNKDEGEIRAVLLDTEFSDVLKSADSVLFMDELLETIKETDAEFDVNIAPLDDNSGLLIDVYYGSDLYPLLEELLEFRSRAKVLTTSQEE